MGILYHYIEIKNEQQYMYHFIILQIFAFSIAFALKGINIVKKMVTK
jgi:hypothetical protein